MLPELFIRQYLFRRVLLQLSSYKFNSHSFILINSQSALCNNHPCNCMYIWTIMREKQLLFCHSQTNAGALWFTCHIQLLREMDASWLLAERSTDSVFPSPSLFRHFASRRTKIPGVQLAKVCWGSARLKKPLRTVARWLLGSRSRQCKDAATVDVTKPYLQFMHNIRCQVRVCFWFLAQKREMIQQKI